MVKEEFYFSDAQCIEFANITGHYIFIKKLFAGHYLFQCVCGCKQEFVAREIRTINNAVVTLHFVNTVEDFILLNN